MYFEILEMSYISKYMSRLRRHEMTRVRWWCHTRPRPRPWSSQFHALRGFELEKLIRINILHLVTHHHRIYPGKVSSSEPIWNNSSYPATFALQPQSPRRRTTVRSAHSQALGMAAAEAAMSRGPANSTQGTAQTGFDRICSSEADLRNPLSELMSEKFEILRVLNLLL